jgi:hypothetical protein
VLDNKVACLETRCLEQSKAVSAVKKATNTIGLAPASTVEEFMNKWYFTVD